MVDLDAPSPTNHSNSQVRHFLGGNFRPSSAESVGSLQVRALGNSTPAVSEFKQPSPTSGLHRYVFLLYRQSPSFNGQTLVNASTPIQRFNITTFAEALDLGNPVGGTFMLVAAPDSV
ncbi:hypothetical protein VKT23_005958 [Stygiomarasmius scandens]|uniref:Flowering locus T n=1 Tax=Marasmiellus scandens TaxID=2682957 RepID=A0ABR1JPR4_9AGAR